MGKITYTKDMIRDIVYELLRRQKCDLNDGGYTTIDDFFAVLNDKFQGAYGAVMVTSTNWPEAAEWFREFDNEVTAWIESILGIELIS